MLALLAASIVASGQTFVCTPTHVWDGDGPVWCAEGPHLRIAGIAAREMDGTCRANQPCPDATAIEARNALVQLMGGAKGTISTGHVVVRGPLLTCRSEGSAGGNRTAAWCRLPSGADLSCAMIKTGTVLRWDRYWKGPACR
ncbi:thermonuclease family protein [Sphingobium fuliginis]|jgi:endonuclease YncB( thermonuclease family)|uniref:thermonuclease family protein n=1 Tax=Sphingobium fuliginis (strain ATCC 27551) TaxID=336203 RepID=UPI0037CAE8C1